MKKQEKFLANYVKTKLSSKIKDIKESDLIAFFNENGWYLYDMEKMAANFEKWYHKHKYY